MNHHLDQGEKVREIAEIVGRRGTRQIRVVRERPYDLRATVLEPVAAD